MLDHFLSSSHYRGKKYSLSKTKYTLDVISIVMLQDTYESENHAPFPDDPHCDVIDSQIGQGMLTHGLH